MKESAVQKVVPPASALAAGGVAQMPDYLRDKAIVGTERLKEYVIVPRLKVIQKQTGEQLRQKFGVGDAILSPLQVLISQTPRDTMGNSAKQGDPFYFCPLFFFVEWVTWNPLEIKGSEPAIAFRTQDPNHPIVAKSRDAKLRQEPMLDASGKQLTSQGKPLNRRHVEHLNWVVRLINHPIADPLIMSFCRGEHFVGSKFAGLVRMRRASPYACVFRAQSAFRQRSGAVGDWYGIDVDNPPTDCGVQPWVPQDMHEENEKFYKEFSELYASKTQGLQADLSEAEDLVVDEAAAAGPREM